MTLEQLKSLPFSRKSLDIVVAACCSQSLYVNTEVDTESFYMEYQKYVDHLLLLGNSGPYVIVDPMHPTFFNRTGFWKSVSYMGVNQ